MCSTCWSMRALQVVMYVYGLCVLDSLDINMQKTAGPGDKLEL